MIKIIADDRVPFLKGILEPFAEIRYLPGRQISRELLKDADALLIRTRTKCTERLLNGTNVKFIGTATIGFDHIDTHYCDLNDIKWTNAPGCNSSSVLQYVAAALLNLSLDFRFSLKDKTLGIIGVGNVGSRIKKLAKALGMKVLINDPPRARKEEEALFSDIETVLRESDIVTLHVPLNIVGEDKTYHLINEKTIKKMKKGVWFINTSRGEVAETSAVKKALDSGRFGGAVIDVWEHEPDFDIDLMHKAYISTPHIAGYSTDGKANGTSMVVNALTKFFNLSLRDWYPVQIPDPLNPIIHIDGKGKNDEAVLREAVAHTYNISEDDLKLRFSPADFERLRGDYKIRREFPAFTIHLKGGSKKVQKALVGLGFKIVN